MQTTTNSTVSTAAELQTTSSTPPPPHSSSSSRETMTLPQAQQQELPEVMYQTTAFHHHRPTAAEATGSYAFANGYYPPMAEQPSYYGPPPTEYQQFTIVKPEMVYYHHTNNYPTAVYHQEVKPYAYPPQAYEYHQPQSTPQPSYYHQPTPVATITQKVAPAPVAAANHVTHEISSPVPNRIYTFESGVNQEQIDLEYLGYYKDVATNKRDDAMGHMIRVWKDGRKHLFYDCVCKKRKPIKNLKAMVDHCNRHREENRKTEFKCEVCGRIFAQILGLNSHRRVHKQKKDEATPEEPSTPSKSDAKAKENSS